MRVVKIGYPYFLLAEAGANISAPLGVRLPGISSRLMPIACTARGSNTSSGEAPSALTVLAVMKIRRFVASSLTDLEENNRPNNVTKKQG